MQLPQVGRVAAAIEQLSTRLQTVDQERVPNALAAGRILAENLIADRPSPALDVSAMDGYALKLHGSLPPTLPVQSTAPAGSPPQTLQPGHAIRIFTGAAVPMGANCIVRREDTIEHRDKVQLTIPITEMQPGQNIRRQGENSPQGAKLLARGSIVEAASIAAVASFGARDLRVYRTVRVAVLNTGDELAEPGAAVEAWQIRDSNGPTLAAWLSQLSWVTTTQRQRVADTLSSVQAALAEQLEQSDAIILTGGVSMGDTDYVPAAIESLGGEIVFHRLPIRPGKPVLGAVLKGKLILGLPGNPVSVAVTARVLGEPLLRKLAGCECAAPRLSVQLTESDGKRIDLTWFRLVNINAHGELHLAQSQGSGDLVSLSQSCGFVEIPPGENGQGPVRLTLW
ncbi:MAG: molybdopterin molybdotransferase MoeA [Planctomycetales bacterium]|nr:molybdopterin molybdotransferase MoeA [Planctomycetales bacterium]